MEPDPLLVVVVPIRSFTGGKARLSPRLGDDARIRFVRELAQRVIDAAKPHTTVVVSSAREVLEWANAAGVTCVPDPGDLNAAADAGRAHAASLGANRVAIVHADLPLIESLDSVTGLASGVTLVPDRFDDGTPVMVVPVDAPFTFRFGPGSFRRHSDEALRLGLHTNVVRDAALRFDVDVPDDLDALDALAHQRSA